MNKHFYTISGNFYRVLGLMVLLFCLFCISLLFPTAFNTPFELREIIKTSIEKIVQGKNSEGEKVYAKEHLIPFYRKRNYAPAWVDHNGVLALGEELINSLGEAHKNGLTKEDYHFEKIMILAQKVEDERGLTTLAELDILLSDAYMMFAFHLFHGKVCPKEVIPDWYAWCKETEINYASYLQHSLDYDEVTQSLYDLSPKHPHYKKLQAALHRYQRFHQIPMPETFIPHWFQDSIMVDALAKNLITHGDMLATNNPDSSTIIKALHKFQKRHGLSPCEFIDDETLRLLKVPLSKRIKTIKVNMERWRWLPEDLGSTHIIVNIAGFNLSLIEQDKVRFITSAIVGKAFTKTPIFSAEMTHIILSPFWVIPNSIVTKEILTKGVNTPDYLTRNEIKILKNQKEVAVDEIDWEEITINNFPYTLRQEPGPGNPLGNIKFIFDNPFHVYVHDTPGRVLFEKNKRAFSHGCIRIKNPFSLAALLLKDTDEWSKQALIHAQLQAKGSTIRLPSKIPIHVLYWTSWVDDDGEINFRDDIYQRDERGVECFKGIPIIQRSVGRVFLLM